MYQYADFKQFIFTEDGQVKFLKIRDNVVKLINASGAVNMIRAISVSSGDDWQGMACVDRMVELGEIREISINKPAAQYRIFTF